VALGRVWRRVLLLRAAASRDAGRCAAVGSAGSAVGGCTEAESECGLGIGSESEAGGKSESGAGVLVVGRETWWCSTTPRAGEGGA
jgi:hypothetical protein